MTNGKIELGKVRIVSGWNDLVKAIEENVPVVEATDRCISPNCRLDWLAPIGMIDAMYNELETVLSKSNTELIVGEYNCKFSERVAEKYGKKYKGRREEYIDHSLEAESSGPLCREIKEDL